MSWGVALRNAVGLGLGGIPSLLNAKLYAILNFDFLSGGFDSRIEFSRTTNATLIGSDGQLQYAPHNLLTYSEQFDNAAWAEQQGSVTPNAAASPDGTQTADLFIPNTAAGDHGLVALLASQDLSLTRTFSIYLKESGLTTFAIYVRNNAQTIGIQGDVDLSAGTITASNYGSPISVLTPTITSVGNGWFRCTVGGALSATTETLRLGILRNFTGNDTDGIIVWGAQLNVGALQPYHSTTVKNLVGYSQDFDNAAWNKNGATITTDIVSAPDGSLTADKLIPDTSTGPHYVTPNPGIAFIVGQVVTYSVYAKAAELTFLQLIFTGIGPAASNLTAGFNLTTGIAGTPTAGSTSSIVSVGNGWYRCSITVSVATAGTPTQQIRPSLNSSSTPSSYTGDGTSGIYIWGGQMSDSASLDPYVYNKGAAPTASVYYGPRFDYDPATLAPKGLLIEEQRTNSLRNNMMVGAVAGSPGTLPTYYGGTTTGGVVTRTIVGTGVEDGITYIDVRFQTTGANNASIRFENGNVIAASPAQVWASAVYVKLVAGSLSNISEARNIIFEYDAAGAFLVSNYLIFTPTSAPLSQQRYLHTKTMVNALTTFVLSGVSLNFTGAGDATIRIGMPQLELGTFSTSVIPTTTAAATRAADVASMTGANFSNWYNPVEGTLVTTTLAINQTLPPNRFVSTMDDGTLSNIIGAYIDTSLNATSFVVNGGVAAYQEVITTVSNTSPNSIAVTYKANDFMSAANGVLGIPDTSGAIPVVNKITFGNRSDGARPLNGHIRSFQYYPTRLPNNVLQALTT